ncbi:MAG: DUF3576 domain-containing protein [Pseudomonadota bacterium]
MPMARWVMVAAAVVGAGTVAGCSGNYAEREQAEPPDIARAPEIRRQNAPSVFGDDGIVFGSRGVGSTTTDNPLGSLLGGSTEPSAGAIPVNRFLWQASLDTLSFLPLASTDPFTGVIATDWGAAQAAPGERFKVTAYIVDTALSAASLRVAVFREIRDESGAWVPAAVSAETPRQIEDAILTRARQIRLAENGVSDTG